jgi:acetyl-CoA carboxylase carboxyl transferase subunit alpha
MFANKLIDGVVPEPLGGAHRNMEVMAQTIKEQVIKDLSELKKIDIDALVNQRIEKFCSMGVVQE